MRETEPEPPGHPSDEPEAAAAIVSIDRGALVRDAIRNTSLLGALASGLALILASPELALAIGVGTGFGVVNFVLLARGVGGAIDRTVAGVERTRQELASKPGGPTGDDAGAADEGLDPELVGDRPRGAGGSFRLALSVVLVAAALFLLPTDPAGVPIGVIITLVGASVAASSHNRRSNPGPRRRV